MKRTVTVLTAALWFCACATHTLLSDADQLKVREAQQGKKYFLRYSFFVGPFFSYEDRLFISERDFDERALLENLSGEPIFNSAPQAVLPFGTPVNIKQLAVFEAHAVVTPEVLVQRRIVRSLSQPIKILGDGELDKPLHVVAHAFSESAREKILAAGGQVELIG